MRNYVLSPGNAARHDFSRHARLIFDIEGVKVSRFHQEHFQRQEIVELETVIYAVPQKWIQEMSQRDDDFLVSFSRRHGGYWYGFVMSFRHQFRGRASWLRYLKEYSTKPGYGRFGWPDDVLDVSSPLHVLERLPVLTSPEEEESDDLLLRLLRIPPVAPPKLPRFCPPSGTP